MSRARLMASCGFAKRMLRLPVGLPFSAGARVWLGLPGIETWPASVVWYEDGKGGLRF